MPVHAITNYLKAKELYEAGLLWMKTPYQDTPLYVPPPSMNYTFSREARFWPPYYTQGGGFSFFIVLEE